MRKKILAVLTAVVVALMTGGAAKAASDTTSLTFTVAAGALSITAPTTFDFGTLSSATDGTSFNTGSITVDDQRNSPASSWEVTVGLQNGGYDGFVLQGGDSGQTNQRKAATGFYYDVSTLVGSGACAPVWNQSAAVPNDKKLDNSEDATVRVSCGPYNGNGGATFDAEIVQDGGIGSILSGVYEATLTHTVTGV